MKTELKRHKPDVNNMGDEELAAWFEASSPADYAVTIDGSAEVLLYRAAKLKKQAEEETVQAVRAAYQKGFTWQRIGDALGMSRQGAYQHYKPLIA